MRKENEEKNVQKAEKVECEHREGSVLKAGCDLIDETCLLPIQKHKNDIELFKGKQERVCDQFRRLETNHFNIWMRNFRTLLFVYSNESFSVKFNQIKSYFFTLFFVHREL
jgi:hypothetical protein